MSWSGNPRPKSASRRARARSPITPVIGTVSAGLRSPAADPEPTTHRPEPDPLSYAALRVADETGAGIWPDCVCARVISTRGYPRGARASEADPLIPASRPFAKRRKRARGSRRGQWMDPRPTLKAATDVPSASWANVCRSSSWGRHRRRWAMNSAITARNPALAQHRIGLQRQDAGDWPHPDPVLR
jgi:hypothetical protein